MPTSSSKPSRLESALTVVSFALIALGLVAIVVSLIVGMNDRFVIAEGPWPLVYGTAFYALPLGFVLMVVAIVLGQRKRRAALRGGDELGT